ncbi:hypothetical protein GIY56_12665 [Paracoccus sp. YIM 132242]|uniref:Uncharacterized protein n=1 Tax=Paracoccus lichenicola TaxID=2665644 RepID=A0A6L6HS43_9RHOB|nr:hypothetical protein [Paracoccus lichenicola]MTE01141.1 hypothetical protein [Paracoccus lichenicola]
MNNQTPLSQVSKEPRLHGVIDILRTDRVAGWVIDRTDAARCASVDVRREGRLIGTVTANRPRKDLERQAVGTGSYGFAFTFDPPLEEGMEFTVVVTARSHDGVELPLQPAAGAAKAVTAEKKVLGRILSELVALRAEVDNLRLEEASAEKARACFQERLELVQLRLESSIPAKDLPQRSSPGWLVGIGVAGAILATGSLIAGLYSLWAA